MSRCLVAVVCSMGLLLAACGGGGSSSTSAPAASGQNNATVTGVDTPSAVAVVTPTN